MENNKYDPRPTVSILVAIAAFLLPGDKMIEIMSDSTRMVLLWVLLFIAALIMLWYFYDLIFPRKKKTSSEKPADRQATAQGNKQISINISINSGDFTDDKMSTKRMNEFHGMVKDISSDSSDDDKQKTEIKK